MRTIQESFAIFFEENILSYFNVLATYPIKIVILAIDLSIVAYLIFKLLKAVKNTRAMQLFKGIAILIIATKLSEFLGLDILHYILSSVMTYGVIMFIVIFQPELRKTLEQIGSKGIKDIFEMENQEDPTSCVKEVVEAAERMSKEKVGALIVFEREMKLTEIARTGVQLDSLVSQELLRNIFVPDTPLHDGAVIIRSNKIVAASCILPITDKENLDRQYGTRHRAAIGMSEQSDAVIVVVSEETGNISLVVDGKIITGMKAETLTKELVRRLEIKAKPVKTQFMQHFKKNGEVVNKK